MASALSSNRDFHATIPSGSVTFPAFSLCSTRFVECRPVPWHPPLLGKTMSLIDSTRVQSANWDLPPAPETSSALISCSRLRTIHFAAVGPMGAVEGLDAMAVAAASDRLDLGIGVADEMIDGGVRYGTEPMPMSDHPEMQANRTAPSNQRG